MFTEAHCTNLSTSAGQCRAKSAFARIHAASSMPAAVATAPMKLTAQQTPLAAHTSADISYTSSSTDAESHRDAQPDWRQLPLPLHERPAQDVCQLTDLKAWHQRAKQQAQDTEDAFVADNGPSSSELQVIWHSCTTKSPNFLRRHL